jgi:ATP-dependent helicase STH1/SNF2
MNDDELNALISRTDDEAAIFAEMDIKREREGLDSWRAQGKHGKPPPPLIQIEELPDCYQTDEPFELDEVVEGRGQHRRNVVSYNDGLNDNAWATVGSPWWNIFTRRLMMSISGIGGGRRSPRVD